MGDEKQIAEIRDQLDAGSDLSNETGKWLFGRGEVLEARFATSHKALMACGKRIDKLEARLAKAEAVVVDARKFASKYPVTFGPSLAAYDAHIAAEGKATENGDE